MVKIFIDPGHGGADPGAVGNGLQEKELTLQISKKIRDLLLQYENAQVRLSRDSDLTLGLSQRTDMANAWGADYLLSVHINSGGGTGFESYIHNNPSSASIVYQNVIHPEVIKQIDLTDRGKKRANFHMVRESTMPALLTENGFIDTPADAVKLKQDAYLNRIALGHVNGLVKAFGLKRKPNTSGNKEESKLYQPTSKSLIDLTERVLQDLTDENKHGDKALSKNWLNQLRKGELTESDAIGLLYAAIERGLLK
ncbi:N-acetylmuramoyl-L-alanine amidase family protein [Cytobacillus massiliigabonensis]|uniref:N-acetylmuramoyl-L-alanine amidase family protein n=1 Tax=Cytobacillus massiliigabonensis TaxID=1871011 RepID=UPI000C836390|nr:N-acetylmuramoyl-L-alanine amidase [Cytobacillus massiliigabonensis]